MKFIIFFILILPFAIHASVLSYVQKNEGYKPRAYKDTLGHLTIGYGTRISSLHLSKSIAELLMIETLDDCSRRLKKNRFYSQLTDNRKKVLLDMCYQLGYRGLKSFKKMLKYIIEGRFILASEEIIRSKYYFQTPTRAMQNAILMEEG